MTRITPIVAMAAMGLAAGLLSIPQSAHASTPSGQVLAWGYNAQGQLGDGTIHNRATSINPSTPAGVTFTAVAAGAHHTLAVSSTGGVMAWGYNGNGELGDGTNTNSTLPVTVQAPTGVTFTGVAAGFDFSLAVASNGTAWAWGKNSAGQLGDGTTTDSNVPVQVSLPANTTVSRVSAGEAHSLALTSTGTVLAWGDNTHGQLGNGTTTPSSVPQVVSLPGGTTVTDISAGEWFALARTSAGGVLAWGGDTMGQLGNGTTVTTGCACSTSPVAVSIPSGTTITAIAAGGYHGLGLTSSGGVLSWGSNSGGQLGNGAFGGGTSCGCSTTPVSVMLQGFPAVTAVAAGNAHSLALTSSGGVLAWGRNSHSQLGDGTTTNRDVPVSVSLPAGVSGIALGGGPLALHSLAIASTARAIGSFVFAPSPIARHGSLAPGATVAITLTVRDTSGAAFGGAPVYLYFQQTADGGSATVGSTALTSTPVRFTADSSGHVFITYHAPTPVPSSGTDIIHARNTPASPTATKTDSYNFSVS